MTESESMTMVERVARAMEPSAFQTFDGGYTQRNGYDTRAFLNAERTVKTARRKARRAIEAMREPTVEMLATTAKERGFVNQLGAKLVWFSMIDAALADTPSTLEE